MPGVKGTLLVAILSYLRDFQASDSHFPSPETLEDALGDFHITHHPQTKHRAEYILDGNIG